MGQNTPSVPSQEELDSVFKRNNLGGEVTTTPPSPSSAEPAPRKD